MKQNSRVTANKEDIEAFHVFVTGNAHADIVEMLEENPTLVYSKDEHGHTALYYAAATGGSANEETAKILMAYRAEVKEANIGEALQLIDDPFMMQDMARIVISGIQFKDYSKSTDAVERAQVYLNREEVKQTNEALKEIGKNAVKDAALKAKKNNSSEWPMIEYISDSKHISAPATPAKPISGRSRRNSI